MDWQEFSLSRLLIHEERAGAEQRAAVQAVVDREDAIFAANKAKMQQMARAR